MAIAPRVAAGARVAAVASAAMIAQQVAGKAVRDALFLSTFAVETLPAMIAASAVVSLLALLWLPGLMVRHAPSKVVPAAFAASGAGLLAEWGASFFAPRAAAIALYLHTALFGAVVISAFWSLINESFAPHASRRAISWITGGGTLGGVLGGLVAWRAAGVIPVLAMLPILAATNLVCVWGTWRLTRDAVAPGSGAAPAVIAADEAPGVPDAPDVPSRSLFHTIWAAPYLRNLALIVALGAVTSGLLDYVFSAVASAHYTSGPELMSFFAKFWLVVGLLSFLLETFLGRFALEKLGLAMTVAILPALVVLGGALGLAVPGLASLVLLRGGEATQRNSLFRAAYELLFTPVSARKKRATKTIIDVGCDRLGTVLAGAIAMVAVAGFGAAQAGMILLVIAMGCALLSVARSVPLHRGYVALLEESLRNAAGQMTPSILPARPEIEVAVRDQVVEQLEPKLELRPVGERVVSIDEALQAILDLRSGQAERVRPVLSSSEPLSSPLVAFAVLLLADKEFHLDAIEALVKAAPTATGQLVDALCDARVDFHVRRRIPRVLGRCPTSAASEGLLRGIEDPRFEVRYACGRALLKIRAAEPERVVALDRIVAILKREIERHVEADDDEDDDGEDDAPSLIDRLRRDRLDRTVEHMFNVLALNVDPESLRTAFKALHEPDEALRGIALEYMETILPDGLRDQLWPLLGETRPMRPARPASAILADLVRSRAARRAGP